MSTSTPTHKLTVFGFWLMLLAPGAVILLGATESGDGGDFNWPTGLLAGGPLLVAGAVLVGTGVIVESLRPRPG